MAVTKKSIANLTVRKKGAPPVPGAGRKPKLLTHILADLRAEGLKIPEKGEIAEMVIMLLQLKRDRLIEIATDNNLPMHLRATAKHIVDSGTNFSIYQAFTDMATGTIRQMLVDNSTHNHLTLVIVDPKETKPDGENKA